MKSIFEKAYLIRAQAEKAAAKEFGDSWVQEYELVAQEGVMPVRWMVKKLATAEPTIDLAQAEADAERIANASMGVDALKPRLSTAVRPTKLVWDIADSMPKASRKDVMAECVRQGVAYGTARTQYQAWFKASQECERGDIRKPYEKPAK